MAITPDPYLGPALKPFWRRMGNIHSSKKKMAHHQLLNFLNLIDMDTEARVTRLSLSPVLYSLPSYRENTNPY